MARQRLFPHLPEIKDPAAAKSLRLLWDSHYAALDRLDAALASITVVSQTVGKLASVGQQTGIVAASAIGGSGEGLLSFSQGGQNMATALQTGVGGSTGGTDDGFGQQGFDAAGPTGHVPAGSLLNAFVAGQVVGGTVNEFPALLLPTTDDAARDAQQLEMLERMIWHLNLAGFTAGRQKNPSGVIGINRLTVYVLAVGGGMELRAYKVSSGTPFSQPWTCYMRQDFPPNYQADGGTPD